MTIHTMVQRSTGGWDGRDLLDPDFDALGDADDYGPWVEAAPFRAHIRHLVGETGVAWRTLAVLADVPTQSVEHLLRGRRGRAVPRLHPLIAERLFHLTRTTVFEASVRQVHAGRSRALLRRLTARGWTTTEIARRTRLPESDLDAVATGQKRVCSQLTSATLKAAAQALWDRRQPSQQDSRHSGPERSLPRTQQLAA